jgi:hypothetical protein
MIDYLSFINSVGEYAYDCTCRNDVLLRDTMANDVMLIQTNHEDIVVTADTQILKHNNGWVRADKLKAGDVLKHDLMEKTVVTNIKAYTFNDYKMIKIVDCANGYLIVNGLFISRDMV